jgi:hypothetical protein
VRLVSLLTNPSLLSLRSTENWLELDILFGALQLLGRLLGQVDPDGDAYHAAWELLSPGITVW